MTRSEDDLRAAWLAVKDDPKARERWLRRETAYLRATSGDDDMYYDRNYPYLGDRYGILPFGREYAKWSPYHVEKHPFGREWLGDSMALICKRTDVDRQHPSRIIHSHGLPPRVDDRIGVSFTAHHDQTGRKLGVYEVVGIVVYDPSGGVGRVVGDVPFRKMALNTYK